jgi:hypothetical protein
LAFGQKERRIKLRNFKRFAPAATGILTVPLLRVRWNAGDSPMINRLQTARQFAAALDNEDYALAESLLDGQCIYLLRGERIEGAGAIVASYRSHGESAKAFDAIEYRSDVVAEREGRFRIHFVDHLTHAGRRHTFRCQQLVDVDPRGKIVRIEHLDLPGQLAALAQFKRRLTDRDRRTV